jgi:hypothetical protein
MAEDFRILKCSGRKKPQTAQKFLLKATANLEEGWSFPVCVCHQPELLTKISPVGEIQQRSSHLCRRSRNLTL